MWQVFKNVVTTLIYSVVESGYAASGKRLKRTKTIRITEKPTPKKLTGHLELDLAKFKIEVESGEYISPEKMLFSEFVEKELKNLPKKNSVLLLSKPI